MHIVVGTRSTPDTAARMEVTADGGVSWGDSPLVINPWDEYAVEEALTLAKEHGGTATVLAVGDESSNEALKHALAMGMDDASRVWQDDWADVDSLGMATAFAAAVGKLDDVKLVLLGKEFTDEATDQHVFQIARKLGWPVLSYVSKIVEIDFDAGTVKVERLLEEGRQTISATLPAVINVMKGINEPRYPSFMGIRKAARATIPVLDAAELGIAMPTPRAIVAGFSNLPERAGECEIIEGEVEAQAKTLVDRLLEEKVI